MWVCVLWAHFRYFILFRLRCSPKDQFLVEREGYTRRVMARWFFESEMLFGFISANLLGKLTRARTSQRNKSRHGNCRREWGMRSRCKSFRWLARENMLGANCVSLSGRTLRFFFCFTAGSVVAQRRSQLSLGRNKETTHEAKVEARHTRESKPNEKSCQTRVKSLFETYYTFLVCSIGGRKENTRRKWYNWRVDKSRAHAYDFRFNWKREWTEF